MIPLILHLLLAGPTPGEAQDGSATVRGTVELEGPAPPRKRIRMDADPKAAAMQSGPVFYEDLVVDKENRVKWAFVYVKQGLEGMQFDPPREPVILRYRRAMLGPRVAGVQIGQEVVVRSEDGEETAGIVHNAHTFPFDNKEMNVGLFASTAALRTRFEAAELRVKVRCDVHPWEVAWVHVLPHPFFAVTGDDGRYELKGLPPGRYTIEVLQERCQPVSQGIEVKANEVKTVDLYLLSPDYRPRSPWKVLGLAGGGAVLLAVIFFLLVGRKR